MSRRGVTCRVQHDQKRGSGNFSRRNTRESGMSTTLSCCLRGSWCGTAGTTGSCQLRRAERTFSLVVWLLSAADTRLYGLADWPRGRPLIGQRSTSKLPACSPSVSLSRHVPACPGPGRNASLRHARSPFTCLQVAESELRIGEKRETELNTVIQMIRHSATFFSVVALASNFFWSRLLFIKNGCTDPMN